MYDPKTFFKERFERFGIDDFRSAGNATKSHNQNLAEYEVAWKTLYAELQKIRGETPFLHANILDIGSGNGFYMGKIVGTKARQIVSVDITDVFFHELEERYPEVEFLVQDAVKGLPYMYNDIILAIDITQHIISDGELVDMLYHVRNATAEYGVFAFTTWNHSAARNSPYEKSRPLDFYRSFFYPPRWTLSPPVKFRDKYLVTATKHPKKGG